MNLLTRLVMTTALIFLAACGGGGGDTSSSSSSTSSSSSGGTSLSLVNAFGQTITTDSADLQSGINTACYNETNSTDGVIQSMSIVGTTFTNELKTFAGNLTCTGTPSDTRTIVGTLTVKTDIAVKGWLSGSNANPDTTPPGKVSYPTTALSTTATPRHFSPFPPFTLTSNETSSPGAAVGLKCLTVISSSLSG